MLYIYARRRDDLTKHYWNRRKNQWQLDLGSSCYYPTLAGANRVYLGMIKDRSILGRRFHEVGFKFLEVHEA
jgi:hypothetical protein